MKKLLWLLVGVLGLVLIPLGSLWLLQGLGVVVIEPVACVGECTPLEGPHRGWAIAGFLTAAAGLSAVIGALRQLRRITTGRT